jgi:hypothetical protein
MFPSGVGFWLIMLNVRVNTLATRLPFSPQEWEEDGLGMARGCFLKLSSGRVILLEELQHSIEHFGAKGPIVMVDVGEAAALGFKALLAEVVADLSLSADEISIHSDDAASWGAEAKELAAQTAAWRKKRAEREKQ